MNSYGGKTLQSLCQFCRQFESSVNSYGGKTSIPENNNLIMFECSVNSYGGKTGSVYFPICSSLRVV